MPQMHPLCEKAMRQFCWRKRTFIDGCLQKTQREDRTDSDFLFHRHVKTHDDRDWDDSQIKIGNDVEAAGHIK